MATRAKVVGISIAVPKNYVSIIEDFPLKDHSGVEKIIAATGIHGRHIANGVSTEEIGSQAVRALLEDLNWSEQSVDVLIVGTQTASRHLPGASSLIAGQFHFKKSLVSFDFNLGCSAFPYGIWMSTKFLESENLKRAILVTGDTLTRLVDRTDRKLSPLFGDGVAATAIEIRDQPSPTAWVFGSDSGGLGLISSMDCKLSLDADQLHMTGPEVFAFGLREVPNMVAELLSKADIADQEIDYWAFHQANRMLLERIFQKLQIAPHKTLNSKGKFGNTSGASIPLAIHENRERLGLDRRDALVAIVGFGVGLSWSAGLLCIDRSCSFPPVVEVVLDT